MWNGQSQKKAPLLHQSVSHKCHFPAPERLIQALLPIFPWEQHWKIHPEQFQSKSGEKKLQLSPSPWDHCTQAGIQSCQTQKWGNSAAPANYLMTHSPLSLLLLLQIPPANTSTQMKGYPSDEFGIKPGAGLDKKWINTTQSTSGYHSPCSEQLFGQNHSFTPPKKGMGEPKLGLVGVSCAFQLVFLLRDPSFSPWLLCPVDFRCKPGKANKNRYLGFKKQETNGLVIIKTPSQPRKARKRTYKRPIGRKKKKKREKY